MSTIHLKASEAPHRTVAHLGIIMDGNGRWAEARGLPRCAGHRAGRAAVVRTVRAALDRGIRVLTLFTFSTDNWGRPEPEVSELMYTFEQFFRVEAAALAVREVRITAMGRRDRLPQNLREAIEEAECKSQTGQRLHLRLAIDYSGRDAIFQAAQRFRQSPDGSFEGFARLMRDAGNADRPGFGSEESGLTDWARDAEQFPDIDLVIRTGGEQRLSNCPLWEIAYAELYFTHRLWPDFCAAELAAAIDEFGTRQRRFGQVPAVAV